MDAKKGFAYLKSRYTDPEYPFRDRLYFILGTAGFLSAVAAFVAALASHLPMAAAVASAMSLFGMLGLMVVSFCVKDITIPRIFCALFLNFFMFPALFWVTGGINCGMVFYFFLGLSVSAMILEGKLRLVVTAASLAFYLLNLHLGFAHPEWAYLLSYEERWMDTLSSFAIVALFIVAAIISMVTEYQAEHNKVLLNAQRLKEQTITDSLTGLYNTRFLVPVLEDLLLRRRERQRPSALILLDIDDFKRVNDEYGHLRGNQTLTRFAELLKAAALEGEYVAARYGGEEFIVVLPNRDKAAAWAFADALRRQVASDERLNKLVGGSFSVSGGVAECRLEETADNWIGRADERMYDAKRQGKNRIVSETSFSA